MQTRIFPGFEHLFQLKDPIAKKVFRGQLSATADALKLTRGESAPEEPVIVNWAMGSGSPSDVVWTTSAHLIILHFRVIDILQKINCTGWQSYEVSLIDKSGTPHGDYAGLQIVGRCGPVIPALSTIVLKQYPGGWFPHLQGHYFDESSWDGTDIFMHAVDAKGRASGHVLVNDKVHAEFLQAKVQNTSFQRLTEVSVSSSVYEIGLADLLPDDFQQRVDAAYAESGVPRPGSV